MTAERLGSKDPVEVSMQNAAESLPAVVRVQAGSVGL